MPGQRDSARKRERERGGEGKRAHAASGRATERSHHGGYMKGGTRDGGKAMSLAAVAALDAPPTASNANDSEAAMASEATPRTAARQS